ncbi:hypothetical protein EK904_009650, partial [Melospiza melodia maxima]
MQLMDLSEMVQLYFQEEVVEAKIQVVEVDIWKQWNRSWNASSARTQEVLAPRGARLFATDHEKGSK